MPIDGQLLPAYDVRAVTDRLMPDIRQLTLPTGHAHVVVNTVVLCYACRGTDNSGAELCKGAV